MAEKTVDKSSELTDLFGACQIKTSMHEAFERLDEFSGDCFDAYIRALVRILLDESGNGSTDHKIGAAKEIIRQISSPSKLFASVQLEKWNGLGKDTKDFVKNSLMFVLANLKSSELVDPLQNVISIIAVTWPECVEEIMSICMNEMSSIHTLTASFMILGSNLVGPAQYVDKDNLLIAFKRGLQRPQINYQEEQFHEMQCATLDFMSNYLNNHGRSLSNMLLIRISENIMHTKVLKFSNEKGCDAAINVFIKIILIQLRMPALYNMKSEAKTHWTQLLKNGLHTQLYAIWAMKMKSASTVKLFFEHFDKF